VNLSLCIQHHPARTHLLPNLLERIGGAELVVDPDPGGEPSPLRTYQECLRRTPKWATHRIVIQDDVWLCDGFREKAETAIAEHPTAFMAFFVPAVAACGGNRMTHALKKRERYANISGVTTTPVVALSWPVVHIEAFLRYCGLPMWEKQRGDDKVVGYFVKKNRLTVLATVPSLVEHPDVEPSLVRGQNFNGKSRIRKAAYFIG
jgi:hypothetical protein